MNKKVIIKELAGTKPNYKVLDADTGEQLILSGDGSLTKLLNKISANGWDVDCRVGINGEKYKLIEKGKNSFGWEEL